MKTASDAPVWLNAEQAGAWADGYNAAADDQIVVEVPTVSVWLRNVGDEDECWVPSAKGDPGAIEFAPVCSPAETSIDRAAEVTATAIMARRKLEQENAQLRAQVESADKRWEAVHDMVLKAREMVRLQIDAKDRPEGLFQALQDALYAIRGREVSNG